MLKKAYKYKLYPTDAQAERLRGQLRAACELYNAAIHERKSAYQVACLDLQTDLRTAINWGTQKKSLTAIRQAGLTDLINCGTGQAILKRVDLAFQAFYRRVKARQTAGYPRFKSARYFDSLPYQSYGNGVRIEGRRLYVQGIGNLKMRWHRELPDGKIKTVTVKREGARWYVVFVVEYNPVQLPATGKQIGIDAGLRYLVAMSDGTVIDNPRFVKQFEAELRIAQRKLARRRKGSAGWHKAKREVGAVYLKMQRARNQFAHDISRILIDENDLIAAEKLQIKNMVRGNLAKSIHDAAWGTLMHCLSYKAAETGRQFVQVNPSGTSQTCICGARVKKESLSVRDHICSACGAEEDRDVMAAKVILQRAIDAKDI